MMKAVSELFEICRLPCKCYWRCKFECKTVKSCWWVCIQILKSRINRRKRAIYKDRLKKLRVEVADMERVFPQCAKLLLSRSWKVEISGTWYSTMLRIIFCSLPMYDAEIKIVLYLKHIFEKSTYHFSYNLCLKEKDLFEEATKWKTTKARPPKAKPFCARPLQTQWASA